MNQIRKSPAAKSPEPQLGDNLRAIRRRNKWSLAVVSNKTGLAVSTLSRLENGQISLTYEKILQLCRGLDLDMSELFAGRSEGPAQPPGMGRRVVDPPGSGRPMQHEHYFYRYLCTDFANKKMTPIFGSVDAHSIEEVGGFLRHEGEEMVYVLEGTLELHTEFYAPLRIEAGGCIYFDSTMGHAFVAADCEVVKFLSVCSRPEPELRAAVQLRSQAKTLPARRSSRA